MRQRQIAIVAYDFSAVKTLVAVGGNQGRLLATILQANPSLRGVLFDLPHVVARAPEYLQTAGVVDRCDVVGGDLFTEVPFVIHDWDDEPAVRILQSCRGAMTAGGTLLLVERVLPQGNELGLPLLSDLVMLAIGGRERTEAEYGALLSAASFELQAVTPSDSPYCLLHARAT